MKKLIILSLALVTLSACSFSQIKQKINNVMPKPSTEDVVREKISTNAQTLSLGEIIDYDWEYVRFIRPYQTKKIYGETFAQVDDKACQWVVLGKDSAGEDSILENFSIERKTIDCVDLPEKTFGKSDSIFLVRDGKLQERKKFKR
jgi:hypothetical protein